MELNVHIDSASQLSLVADEATMNARIEISGSDTNFESEWSTTPFVDVPESGDYKITIRNEASEPLLAELHTFSF